MVFELGEIYFVKLPESTYGSAQSGYRPCIIAQSSTAIRNCSMIWVIPLTSKLKALHIPVHVIIKKDDINKLKTDSMALVESMSYIPKDYVCRKIGEVSRDYFSLIGEAIKRQFPMAAVA